MNMDREYIGQMLMNGKLKNKKEIHRVKKEFKQACRRQSITGKVSMNEIEDQMQTACYRLGLPENEMLSGLRRA